MIDDHDNVEKNDIETTHNDIPIVPPQNQDESIIREAPATSTTSISTVANGEGTKEKDTIEASKSISDKNDNLPKNDENNPNQRKRPCISLKKSMMNISILKSIITKSGMMYQSFLLRLRINLLPTQYYNWVQT